MKKMVALACVGSVSYTHLLNPTGVIPNNKAIASYELDKKYVTIYAKQSVLDSIDEIPITIPASTLKMCIRDSLIEAQLCGNER